MTGRLILCSSPIGNLDDSTPRLAKALAGADVVYVEDTRRAAKLLSHLGVKAATRSYFAGNEEGRSKELRERLAAGETVALLTDAGTPAISDPGYTAVRSALAAGAEITIVPGPSAVTAALALSGLPSERFVFEGFLPKAGKARLSRLSEVCAEQRTVVLFSTPRRLLSDMANLKEACGSQREVAVCREMTKTFEEVWRGTLGEAVDAWGDRDVKGEITVVIAGASKPETSIEDALARVRAARESGLSLSDAVRTVADGSGVSRRLLYEAALSDQEI